MPSETILNLATAKDTVTKAVSENPTEEITKVARRLFPDHSTGKIHSKRGDVYTSEDLDRAEKCGRFPYRPSDLFLKASITSIYTLYPAQCYYLDVL